MGTIKDPLFARQRIMQCLMQGIMLGTIFWQTEQDILKVRLYSAVLLIFPFEKVLMK